MQDLILEKDFGVCDRLTCDDLERIMGDDLADSGLDLVILSFPYSKNIAQYMYDFLGVNNIIYFQLDNYPCSGEPIVDFLKYNDSISEFVKVLYEELFKHQTLEQAYSTAEMKMRLMLEQDYNMIIRETTVGCMFNTEELVLFPESNETSGSPMDISLPLSISNISYNPRFFIGRQIELYNALVKIKDTKKVQISGAGKTTFLTYLGQYIRARSLYSDGVYLVDLKDVTDISGLGEQLQKIGRKEIITNSLSDSDILLLLDNCDGFITQSRDSFEQLIKMLNFPIVVASNLNFQSQEIKKIPLRVFTYPEASVLFNIFCYKKLHDDPELIERIQRIQLEEEIIKKSQNNPIKIEELVDRITKHGIEHVAIQLKLLTLDSSDSSYPELSNSLSRTSSLYGQRSYVTQFSMADTNLARSSTIFENPARNRESVGVEEVNR